MTRKPASSRVLAAIVLFCLALPTLAEDAPATKVEVLQPAAGVALADTVAVRVRITPPEGRPGPGSVRVGLGGAPWTALTAGEGGTWMGEIDTTMVPNGPQALTVVTVDTGVQVLADVALANPLNVYFANLHCHTCYSDGTLLPCDAHEYARHEAKLDVFCLTDHLEYVDDLEWLDIREVAWDANEDGAFVAFPGLEWTKEQGHACIYDAQSRHWPAETASMYQAAADAGVIVKFNHPGDGATVFDGLAYSEVGDKAVQLMEVRSDEEQQAYIRALNNGWHIAPDGSDDTHSSNWGSCGTWTAILAPGLSKRNILDALRNRRCYSTQDRNCRLSFTVNGVVMGGAVTGTAKEFRVVVAVEDPDDADQAAKVELFRDGAVVETHEPNSTRCRSETVRTPEPGQHYYFVKVTQADGNVMWSAPVWVVVPEVETVARIP